MTPSAAPRPLSATNRRLEIAASIIALALVAAVAAIGLFASKENVIALNRSFPLAARVDAARRVTRLRPFSRDAEVRYAILRGRQLFAEGTWDAAQELLYQTYLRNIGNKPLRAEISRVSKAIMLRDAGKAHKQHGHEGPMGELAPEDIER